MASNWQGDCGWSWVRDRFDPLQSQCMHQSAGPTDTYASLPSHIICLTGICTSTYPPLMVSLAMVQTGEHLLDPKLTDQMSGRMIWSEHFT